MYSELLRSILAVGVVAHHGGLGGPIGPAAVMAFYALSGFVLVRFARAGGGVGLGPAALFRDRMLKLYPVYLLGFLMMLAVSPPQPWERIAFESLLIGNNWSVFVFWSPWPLLNPSFSLAAELQMYLLVPLLLRLKRRWLMLVSGLVLLLLAEAILLSADYQRFAYYSLFGALPWFLFGHLLARLQDEPELGPVVAGLYLGLAVVIFGLSQGAGDERLPTLEILQLALISAPLGLVVLLDEAAPRRSLGLALRVSYPIYILHYPVLRALEQPWAPDLSPQQRVLLALLLSGAAGMLLEVLLLRGPVRRLQRRLRDRARARAQPLGAAP